MKLIDNLKKYFTPMTREGFAFTDTVENVPVYYYRDAFGQRWLKTSKFSLFRVKIDG